MFDIKRNKKLALSAVLASFSVVIMYLGSLLDIFDLTTAAIASLIVYFAVIEIGGIYPWGIWFVSSTLSLILLPTKFGALCYALFAGVYPMFKLFFERQKFIVGWTLKLSLFGTSMIAISLLLKYVFVGEYQMEEFDKIVFLVYLLGCITFILFDIAMTKLLILYTVKVRTKLKIDRLLK